MLKGEAVNACKTVMYVCVCVSEKHKQKTDKSDMKRYSLLCKAGFFLLKYFFAITNLC